MKYILPLIVAAGVAIPHLASAAVSDEDFQELREQLAAVSARLEQLAAENAELREAQEQSATAIADVETTVADMPEAKESWS
ncbi:MAG: hypothetical protein QNI96_12160, partial [Woeseiaceae bacterium]|nr:hypothetical protein [Woeseiaceae bacterium]